MRLAAIEICTSACAITQLPRIPFQVWVIHDPPDDLQAAVQRVIDNNPHALPDCEPGRVLLKWKSKGRFMKWVRARRPNALRDKNWIGPLRLVEGLEIRLT